jgi:hypothetical protein
MDKSKLTMPRYVNSVSRIGQKVFVLGGHHPRKGVGLKDVEFADLDQNSLVWKATSPMKSGRYAFGSFSFENNLYAAGGISGSEYLSSIEFANIEEKKSEISWQNSINLPLSMANFTTIVVNKRVYVLGGSSRHDYLNTVWFSSFNNNGAIGYWGSQEDQAALQTNSREQFDKNKLINTGVVIKTINTEGYTYLLVEERLANDKDNPIWLAAPKMDVQKNMRVRYSEGVYMSNFFSKSLGRTFDSILFVGTVSVVQ